MANDPTSDEVAALRRKTGMPLLACRDLLRDAPPDRREKLLVAVHTQEGARHLRDPIEDDPALAPVFQEASREAHRLVEEHVAAQRAQFQAEGMSKTPAQRTPWGGLAVPGGDEPVDPLRLNGWTSRVRGCWFADQLTFAAQAI
jgi:hypothetical protein